MKLEKDHVVIETAEEAAVFGHIFVQEWFRGYQEIAMEYVLEAITPKEGDAVFCWNNQTDDRESPKYIWHVAPGLPDGFFDGCGVKANAITTGKAVGELRELLAWAKGKE